MLYSVNVQAAAQTAARQALRRATVDPSTDSIAWIEANFYIPETNAPIVLMPYQRTVLRQALSTTPDGLFNYSLVLWSDIKKSAKSTIAGAICLYLAWHNAWETVRVIGNDLKQADSRTFFYIERAILLNPALKAVCKIKRYEIELPNHSQILAIPVDPKGEAGGGDLVTCWTELWAAKNTAAKQLWSETTLSPLKFGRSMRLCESYAGFTGDSPILESLYENGVNQGVRLQTDIDGLELYENRAARQLTLWNTQPRCTWQSSEYYAQEAASLTDSEFRRMHRNEWVTSTNSFVQPEWWEACRTENLPPFDAKRPMIGAIDAAVSNDCFGFVALSRHGDKVIPRIVRKWQPHGKALDYDAIEAELTTIIRENHIPVIVYDPSQMHHMAGRLANLRLSALIEFQQGKDRNVADKQLYDMIVSRLVNHDGSHHDLTEHITNAAMETSGESKFRIVKRPSQDHLKIDLAVCLSMAAHTAMAYNIG